MQVRVCVITITRYTKTLGIFRRARSARRRKIDTGRPGPVTLRKSYKSSEARVTRYGVGYRYSEAISLRYEYLFCPTLVIVCDQRGPRAADQGGVPQICRRQAAGKNVAEGLLWES